MKLVVKALKSFVGIFSKKGKCVKKQIVGGENSVTPNDFAKLVAQTTELNSVHCKLAKDRLNKIIKNNEMIRSIISILSDISALLFDLRNVSLRIDYIYEQHLLECMFNVSNEEDLGLSYESNFSSHEELDLLELESKEISQKIVSAYERLYEVTEGKRHLVIKIKDNNRYEKGQISLNGALVLVERILQSKCSMDQTRNLKKLRSLMEQASHLTTLTEYNDNVAIFEDYTNKECSDYSVEECKEYVLVEA